MASKPEHKWTMDRITNTTKIYFPDHTLTIQSELIQQDSIHALKADDDEEERSAFFERKLEFFSDKNKNTSIYEWL